MSEETLEAFEKLNKALTEAPCLVHPDVDRTFLLQTDASNIAVGAVLVQKQEDGWERPVGYFSKRLTTTQQRYCTFEKECLVIMQDWEHFRVSTRKAV